MLRNSGHAAHARAARVGSAFALLFGERIPSLAVELYGPRGLRLLLNIATALLVLALPFSAVSSQATTSDQPIVAAQVASFASDDQPARAATAARGLITGSRSPMTVLADDVRPVVNYTIGSGDTLSTIANFYSIGVDELAFANGIDDEGTALRIGVQLLIPPGHGALYFVKDGDTIASVAQRFKVEPNVIMNYNRLYFEPEHFNVGQLIFVPGAEVPAMKRVDASRSIPVPQSLPERTGRLSWPVGGVLTQYFWWGHTGVDIAAPYGTGIAASDDGVVVATGWVAVGGLRVCVQHAGGLQTCYYHTSSVYVTPGQVVSRGQLIAAIGMTGVTTGPHVHWEVKLNGAAVNPLAY